ncbi:uroporphyrinogen-III synthase [Salinicoccus bachuensis]|uniref:Uroporphyrinogen-III synthase n=1 Tax=Salinicoccus bachuensis TaxID=3136731 RepID=A0ABZ3CEF1_9STAP
MKNSRPSVIMTQSREPEFRSGMLALHHVPLITTERLPFDASLLEYEYDWLVLTSRNAVEHFLPFMESVKFGRLASIGRKTSESLESHGFTVDFEPPDYSQEGFMANFAAHPGDRVLYPVSERARPLLYEHLGRQGCMVARINLYRPVDNGPSREALHALLLEAPYAITFSSPSGVWTFMNWFSPDVLDGMTVAAIGHVTAEALRECGIDSIQPEKETIEDMILMLEDRIDRGV